MTTKQEIIQIISNLPNDKLAELLQYLRQVEQTSHENTATFKNLTTIVKEDTELLKRLSK
ncbi:MAG TPA: hypothetical protein VEC36_06590 [Patescibacteria group bacterium]|nr:hypothetical protein [Patescibacteria group bacterium]